MYVINVSGHLLIPGTPCLVMVRTSMDTEVEVDPINTKTNMVAIRNHQNTLTLITKKTC